MALVTYHTEYKDYRLLYSGDITYGQKIERPFTMKIDDKKLKVDVLICESTYGLREEHKNSNSNKNPIDFLEEVILKTKHFGFLALLVVVLLRYIIT